MWRYIEYAGQLCPAKLMVSGISYNSKDMLSGTSMVYVEVAYMGYAGQLCLAHGFEEVL